MLQVKKAKELYDSDQFKEALDIYLELKETIGSTAFDLNIEKIRNKLCNEEALNDSIVSFGKALESLGVEKVYVVNLEKRPDRKLRMMKECVANSLNPEFMIAVDAKTSKSKRRKSFVLPKNFLIWAT